jgi:hydrogenase nickel incorporation protein HypA/HybF
MHELSIADAIARIAARHAGERRVAAVEVRIGHLRQVVPDSLEFAFALLVEGTPLEGADLRLEQVAPAGRCRACGTAAELEGLPLRCPACGGLDVALERGEELLVTAIELAAEEPLTTGGMAHGDH